MGRANLDTVEHNPGYRRMIHNDTLRKSQDFETPTRGSLKKRKSSSATRRNTMMVNESAVKVNSANRQRAPPVYFSPPLIPRGSLTQKR